MLLNASVGIPGTCFSAMHALLSHLLLTEPGTYIYKSLSLVWPVLDSFVYRAGFVLGKYSDSANFPVSHLMPPSGRTSALETKKRILCFTKRTCECKLRLLRQESC